MRLSPEFPKGVFFMVTLYLSVMFKVLCIPLISGNRSVGFVVCKSDDSYCDLNDLCLTFDSHEFNFLILFFSFVFCSMTKIFWSN